MGYDYYIPEVQMPQDDSFSTVLLIVFLVFLLGFLAVMFLYLIGAYIGSSVAIMKLCKKLGIDKAYLGFVPFANSYKLGQVADVLCEKNRDKGGWAKKLLIMHIVSAVSALIFSVFYAILSTVLEFIPTGPFYLILSMVILVCYIILMAIDIAVMVFAYIAHWKIFKYTNEKTAVLFLVLSILLGSWPFLLITAFSKKPIPDPYAEAEIPETL